MMYIYTEILQSFNYQNEWIQRSIVCCLKGKCPCTVNEKLWKAEKSGDEIQWRVQVCSYLRQQKSGEKIPSNYVGAWRVSPVVWNYKTHGLSWWFFLKM